MAAMPRSQLDLPLPVPGGGGDGRPPRRGSAPPPPPPPTGPSVQPVALHEATRRRYLNYALSVITSRALPDVRDGLKPVQRRILYGMFHNLHLTHDARFRKSAAIVGEVMAKYHPHGDVAIYDAMVRMAQTFSLRYPLVDGHGNFGSIDGDGAAAMRYTEARLRALSEELLDELRKETVDERPNYDGTTSEPTVLPARFPNLLVNGSAGIAVGMATNVPPHNLSEVVKAAIALVDDRTLTVPQLMGHVRAPDFPTGGRILNSREELQAIYETGSGPVRLRGEYVTEVVDRRKVVVITSIPYGVTKSAIVEKIAELIVARRVPQIVDVRDESTDQVRVVLEIKRGEEAEVAMAYLFRHTPLQLNFHVNMTCLVPTESGVPAPRRVDLKQMLEEFLGFRFEVVTRRLRYDLKKLRERIHILEGFEKVFDALDEAIRIVRSSEGKADAAARLMGRFGLDALQADAVLETKLYKLAKMEIQAIREELAEKRAEAERLEALLRDPDARWAVVRAELREVLRLHGDRRRSVVGGDQEEPEFDPDRYILRENAWVVVTRGGWIKRQKGVTQVSSIRVREGDEVGWLFRARTTESVALFTNLGSCYTVRVADVPQTTGHGEPVQRLFNFEDGERVVGVLCSDRRHMPAAAPEALAAVLEGDPRPPYAVALTRAGKCLRFGLESFLEPSTRSGRRFARLDGKIGGDAVLGVELSDGTEAVAVASERGRVILFRVEEINLLRGPGLGLQAMRLDDEDRLLGFTLVHKRREGLEVETNRGARVIVRETRYPVVSRGGRGYEVVKRGRFVKVILPPLELETGLTEGEDEGSGGGEGGDGG
ncbi:DNA topoisomerase IV subunit A [Myxococcota bacterium]|nr:DNA topoisomerase IV subunit A [Myxococcota bacterium]